MNQEFSNRKIKIDILDDFKVETDLELEPPVWKCGADKDLLIIQPVYSKSTKEIYARLSDALIKLKRVSVRVEGFPDINVGILNSIKVNASPYVDTDANPLWVSFKICVYRVKQFEWDFYYLGMAKFASSKSKDPSTKTGAVIVRSDNSQCSVGYNGFPRGMIDKPEDYQNREIKYSKIIHAEMNAKENSRDNSMLGYTVYTYPFLSCERCFVHLVNSGIRRFVAPKCPEHLKERWEPHFEKVRKWASEFDFEVKIDEVEFY